MAKKTSEPALDIAGDEETATVSPETTRTLINEDIAPLPAAPARQGDQGRPYCSRHNCLMQAVGSSPKETRYACPVELCDQKEKRARGTVQIPREPRPCPDVRCQGKAMQSFLEVDLRRSSMAHLCMVCPKCGYDIKVPRPSFNSGQRTYERDEGDLAAR